MACLAVSGCQEDGADLSACGADELQDLVGQSPEMMGMIDLPEDTRMLGPDDAATTDFVPDRLNVSYDEAGVVTRVWCG
ncbi:MAG: I78 family peptidase inhibitor [Pseudomonadota bacterium]